MILCLPFLMFQGRAQEAIDYYLETFPDAELLEILHHPEGTEIFDPAAQQEELTSDQELDEAEVSAPGTEQLEADDEPTSKDLDDDDRADSHHASSSEHSSFPEDSEDFQPPAPQEPLEDESLLDAETESVEENPQSGGTAAANDAVEAQTPASSTPSSSAWMDDTAAMETVVDWQTTLVATAQLRIGGQVLMIQDSLIKHEFDFTPSISVAVVVDTEDEFTQITQKLAAGGSYLMEPGDYDFAKNFAWVQDKFGVSWQINQPLGAPEPGSDLAKDVAQAQAPDWG